MKFGIKVTVAICAALSGALAAAGGDGAISLADALSVLVAVTGAVIGVLSHPDPVVDDDV